MNHVSVIVFSLLFILCGCKKSTDDIPQAPIVVKGYLYGGEPISNIYLESVATSREFANGVNVPIETAHVSIFSEGEEIILSADSDRPGYYSNLSHFVKPNSSYSIDIDYEGQDVKAHCFVPDTLTITKSSQNDVGVPLKGDSLRFSISEGSSVNFSWPELEGFEYLFSLFVQDEEANPITFLDGPGKFNDVYASTTKLNRADLSPDLFSFFGKHQFTIYSVSPEYSEYVNYSPQSTDRQLYNAPNNIDGGYGVFAGLTGTTFEILIEE